MKVLDMKDAILELEREISEIVTRSEPSSESLERAVELSEQLRFLMSIEKLVAETFNAKRAC